MVFERARCAVLAEGMAAGSFGVPGDGMLAGGLTALQVIREEGEQRPATRRRRPTQRCARSTLSDVSTRPLYRGTALQLQQQLLVPRVSSASLAALPRRKGGGVKKRNTMRVAYYAKKNTGEFCNTINLP